MGTDLPKTSSFSVQQNGQDLGNRKAKAENRLPYQIYRTLNYSQHSSSATTTTSSLTRERK